MAVTVTREDQVTIAKPVRDRFGIKPGSKVDFEVAVDGRAFLRRVGKPTVKPSRFERMRGTATSGLTTDEIMALTRGDWLMTLVDAVSPPAAVSAPDPKEAPVAIPEKIGVYSLLDRSMSVPVAEIGVARRIFDGGLEHEAPAIEKPAEATRANGKRQ